MDVIKSLASTMADQHWSKYTTYRPDSLHHKLLQQVVAYSLTGRTVTRAQVLVEGGAYPIRVQDVEADGMVVLLHAGEVISLMTLQLFDWPACEPCLPRTFMYNACDCVPLLHTLPQPSYQS